MKFKIHNDSSPDLTLSLETSDNKEVLFLKARTDTGYESCLLNITKHGIYLNHNVCEYLGLPLDNEGHVKITDKTFI